MTQPTFPVGARVALIQRPPYFKTADPMPMLRPPDLLPVGSEGIITDVAAAGAYVVRFERGSFLVNGSDLGSPLTHQTRSDPTISPQTETEAQNHE